MIMPSTRLSRTRAMMSATALRKQAQATRESARTLSEEKYYVASQNLYDLADWYDETADALDTLDRDGTPIIPDDTKED